MSSGPGDQIVRMRVSPQARTQCPGLPEFWQARAVLAIDARGRQRILPTSLTDRRRFRAADIVSCYERRWQIETTSYHELKQSMLGMELTLRSQTVEGQALDDTDARLSRLLADMEEHSTEETLGRELEHARQYQTRAKLAEHRVDFL
ncbi:hypothetical protein OKW49_002909 [Paraburkholderia youngii]